jgi:DNA-directed RNA polymerase specialized sigma24 family protein
MAQSGQSTLPVGTDADLFQAAKAAAAQGRPDDMLHALGASMFLDGLVRMHRKRWGQRLPASEIEDCIAESVDAAYDGIRAGKPVHDLGAWLWKVADKAAQDRWTNDYRRRRELVEAHAEVLDQVLADDERAEADALAEHRKLEAVRFARQLLPRLGQGQITDVMGLLIDAVEQRLPDLPANLVADTLSISAGSARKLMSRGLARLQREAAKEGIEFPDTLVDDGDDPEDSETEDDQ